MGAHRRKCDWCGSGTPIVRDMEPVNHDYQYWCEECARALIIKATRSRRTASWRASRSTHGCSTSTARSSASIRSPRPDPGTACPRGRVTPALYDTGTACPATAGPGGGLARGPSCRGAIRPRSARRARVIPPRRAGGVNPLPFRRSSRPARTVRAPHPPRRARASGTPQPPWSGLRASSAPRKAGRVRREPVKPVRSRAAAPGGNPRPSPSGEPRPRLLEPRSAQRSYPGGHGTRRGPHYAT